MTETPYDLAQNRNAAPTVSVRNSVTKFNRKIPNLGLGSSLLDALPSQPPTKYKSRRRSPSNHVENMLDSIIISYNNTF